MDVLKKSPVSACSSFYIWYEYNASSNYCPSSFKLLFDHSFNFLTNILTEYVVIIVNPVAEIHLTMYTSSMYIESCLGSNKSDSSTYQ